MMSVVVVMMGVVMMNVVTDDECSGDNDECSTIV